VIGDGAALGRFGAGDTKEQQIDLVIGGAAIRKLDLAVRLGADDVEIGVVGVFSIWGRRFRLRSIVFVAY
jgi:hypothetical protein